MRRTKRSAFTLVELLVVIGIIALLISVLLPALNAARAQASLIDCQSRLRQMGQSLAIYVVDSKGYVPWGVVDHTVSWATPVWTATPADAEQYWWWYFALGQIMNPKLAGTDGLVHNLPRVFSDRDTIDPGGALPRYTLHYAVNPRIFYDNKANDNAPNVYQGKAVIRAQQVHPRKLAAIKPTNVFAIWDSAQILDQQGNAYGIAIELDGNQFTYGHCLCLGTPNAGVNYNRPVTPGGLDNTQDASEAKANQISMNRDMLAAFTGSDAFLNEMRFRHIKNTMMNGLCLDGHVESRRVGETMLSDVCTNYPY